MIFDIFKKDTALPMTAAERGLVYTPAEPGKTELREIEKAFARLFSSDDGQKVLAHLQVVTFQRALGPGVGDDQLRYLEGQRAMVATILRLIDRGRKPQ
ncbi:MAG TPA: hypothetical protein PK513_01100 [Alphaproteobacteria bacterium]|nr:hypothetical protein [Alphaproteobacteria bacterium]